jgi:hypothetical protein
VLSALAVVAFTLLLIWLLRPSPADRFDGGGGGLFNRQPRAAWLVALTVAGVIAFVVWVLRTRRFRRRRRLVLVGGCVVLLGAAIVGGVLWPEGLLRKYETVDQSDLVDLTATSLPSETPAPPETTSPGGTGAPAETSTPGETPTTAAGTPTSVTPTAPTSGPSTGSP